MSVAIDRTLTFVMPVETPKGEAVVRSTPVSAVFFRRHFLVISKTFNRLHAEGLNALTAFRVAAMMLEQIEREDAGVGPDDLARPSPIMNEIRRRTMVEYPGQGAVTWDQVVSAKMFGEEDIGEVENAVVFFIVASAMYHRRDVEAMVGGAAKLWNARLESSKATASETSSQTSTAPASSGDTAKASSIPR